MCLNCVIDLRRQEKNKQMFIFHLIRKPSEVRSKNILLRVIQDILNIIHANTTSFAYVN